ncbi:MAG: hypothetical protein OIF32_09560, partial [Campylobacterales bacterium]|nr:hypothetical protein [Campylobacterales bacterium]
EEFSSEDPFFEEYENEVANKLEYYLPSFWSNKFKETNLDRTVYLLNENKDITASKMLSDNIEIIVHEVDSQKRDQTMYLNIFGGELQCRTEEKQLDTWLTRTNVNENDIGIILDGANTLLQKTVGDCQKTLDINISSKQEAQNKNTHTQRQ